MLFHGNNGYASAPQCYIYTYIASIAFLLFPVLPFSSLKESLLGYDAVLFGRQIPTFRSNLPLAYLAQIFHPPHAGTSVLWYTPAYICYNTNT